LEREVAQLKGWYSYLGWIWTHYILVLHLGVGIILPLVYFLFWVIWGVYIDPLYFFDYYFC
jgi:hypothetical protein